MEVPGEFQKIRFFFYDDGLVAVLEQMPRPFVASVEGARVPVRSDRMLRAKGQVPVRTSRWK